MARKMLSYGGKMVLIKSVLQSLPTYTIVALNPPKRTIDLTEKHIARFCGDLLLKKKSITGLPGINFVFRKMRVEWALEASKTSLTHLP